MALEGLERVLQVGQGGKIQKLLPPNLLPEPPSTGASITGSSKGTSATSPTSSSDATPNDGCGRCKECRKAAELSAICFETGSPPPSGTPSDYRKGTSAAMYGPSTSGSGGSTTRSGAPDALLIAKQASLVWKEHFATCALCTNSYSKISGSNT